MRTKRSGCAYGNGRISTLSTTVNIAVFAPMPNASVSTASAANPGELRNCRRAERRSWRSVCIQAPLGHDRSLTMPPGVSFFGLFLPAIPFLSKETLAHCGPVVVDLPPDLLRFLVRRKRQEWDSRAPGKIPDAFRVHHRRTSAHDGVLLTIGKSASQTARQWF